MHAFVVSTATNADKLMLPQHTNRTWSLVNNNVNSPSEADLRHFSFEDLPVVMEKKLHQGWLWCLLYAFIIWQREINHPNSPNLVYYRRQTGNKHVSSSARPVPAHRGSQSHRSSQKLLQLHAQATKPPQRPRQPSPPNVHRGSNKDTKL